MQFDRAKQHCYNALIEGDKHGVTVSKSPIRFSFIFPCIHSLQALLSHYVIARHEVPSVSGGSAGAESNLNKYSRPSARDGIYEQFLYPPILV
jgi:hypothetical protein